MRDVELSATWQTMLLGSIEVRYYVREPSPDQWNAIAVIQMPTSSPDARQRCPLVVGCGTTYFEAMGDLIARVLGGMHPDLPRHLLERETPVPDPDVLATALNGSECDSARYGDDWTMIA